MREPQLCTPDHVDSWMNLAQAVEDLFGPMPDLRSHVERGIGRGTATVVLERDTVVGAMLLSGPGKPHYIRWLAVHPHHRNRGIGTALLTSALGHWPEGDISVVTFPADRDGGRAARRLYQKYGFTTRGRTDPAPDGSARELFVLSR